MMMFLTFQPVKKTPLSRSSLKRMVLAHGKMAKFPRAQLSIAASPGTPP
ncbi:hypothetical protein Goarm_023432 [Gossypium armourianum]|uniref:Uncharacterized protein n=1 Tax=Gossypium armourianum TaxID=34283 RepID=A0A7J9KGR4_9ROSI|nr:hypothetical protein [Gossypium armourianum]